MSSHPFDGFEILATIDTVKPRGNRLLLELHWDDPATLVQHLFIVLFTPQHLYLQGEQVRLWVDALHPPRVQVVQ